jgi:hypothetical protein
MMQLLRFFIAKPFGYYTGKAVFLPKNKQLDMSIRLFVFAKRQSNKVTIHYMMQLLRL